jgi:hypothetical protein
MAKLSALALAIGKVLLRLIITPSRIVEINFTFRKPLSLIALRFAISPLKIPFWNFVL